MRFVRRITSGYNRYYKIFIFKSYTIGKELYRLFYYGVEKFMIKIASWYANFGRKRLKLLLKAEKPDIVINTFPIIAVPELKSKQVFQFLCITY